MLLIKFLYWVISTLELLLMKILTNSYVDNIIFNSFTRSIIFPYNLWKIYKLYKLKKKFNPRWFDIMSRKLFEFEIKNVELILMPDALENSDYENFAKIAYSSLIIPIKF